MERTHGWSQPPQTWELQTDQSGNYHSVLHRLTAVLLLQPLLLHLQLVQVLLESSRGVLHGVEELCLGKHLLLQCCMVFLGTRRTEVSKSS